MAENDSTTKPTTGAKAEPKTTNQKADTVEKTSDAGQAAPAPKAAQAPKASNDGLLPEMTGADADMARRTGLRTGGTTTAAAEEYARLDVDPRLDNRLGRQRPQASAFAPKPQQFSGPVVGHLQEHEERHGERYRELFGAGDDEARGMEAPGPHGRGYDDELAPRLVEPGDLPEQQV